MGEKMAPCSQEFSDVNWKKGRSWKNQFTSEKPRVVLALSRGGARWRALAKRLQLGLSLSSPGIFQKAGGT